MAVVYIQRCNKAGSYFLNEIPAYIFCGGGYFMVTKNSPIGVLDSGVGGLTTVNELLKTLPNENIIYFGDNKNVPYGNKRQDQIINLTRRMIEFLISKDVKVLAVACNTISTIIDYISKDYDIKILKIIDPVVSNIKNIEKKDKVGLIATNFTINSGYYDKMLSGVKLLKQGSPELAAIVDSGYINKEEIKDIIKYHINKILTQDEVNSIILGCTHYPIIKDLFEECYPNINFVDPAYHQAKVVKDYLKKNNLLREENINPKLEIYTTGEIEKYDLIMKMLSMETPYEIYEYDRVLDYSY